MPGRRKIIYASAAVALLLIALIVWAAVSLNGRAALGAAYGARITCSCRYVEGREMGSCHDDKEPGMALVSLTDLPESRAVRASVPLMASRTARFKPGWGCLLDPVD